MTSRRRRQPELNDAETAPKRSPRVPTHVGIIMDGNGRWANDAAAAPGGPQRGTENVRRITIACCRRWRRSPDHLRVLDRELASPRRRGLRPDALLAQRIDREAAELHRNNVRIRHIGELQGIQPRWPNACAPRWSSRETTPA